MARENSKIMDSREFYTIYIPALEKALKNDNINYGFYVKSPEDFIDINNVRKVDSYINDNEDDFLEMVTYYFDAKAHYFPSIQGVEISNYKIKILYKIEEIKNQLSLQIP